MALRLTAAQARQLGTTTPKAPLRPWHPYRSQWEHMYTAWLDQERRAGNLMGWHYESLKILLGKMERGTDYSVEGEMPMAKTYYDDATAILTAYLECAPDRRVGFVRGCISTQDDEIDIVKLHKAVDTILLAVEKARGQLASQLATSYAVVGSAGQLALFVTGRLNAATEKLTGEVQE